MKEEDQSAFFEIIDLLAAVFEKEISIERRAAYFKFLETYTIQEIDCAAKKLATSVKFFPAVSDFIETINGNHDERAQQAWYNFTIALRRLGPEKSVDFGDPFAHAALKDMDLWGEMLEQKGYPDSRITGTYIARCNCGNPGNHETYCESGMTRTIREDQTTFLRAEFIKRYRYHLRHSDPRTLPRHLSGSFEQINQRKLAMGEDRNWTPQQRAIAESVRIIAVAELPPETPRTPMPALPAPKAEEMPQEIRALLSGKESTLSQPKFMSDEEVARRKEELRKQVEALK